MTTYTEHGSKFGERIVSQFRSREITKHQLMALMFCDKQPFVQCGEIKGVLVGLSREDGSGSSFNLVVQTQWDGMVNVYCRTID